MSYKRKCAHEHVCPSCKHPSFCRKDECKSISRLRCDLCVCWEMSSHER